MTKDSLRSAEFNLFLTPSDTELTEFIEEVMALGDKFPAIHTMIADDQDALARSKKKLRILDRQYACSKVCDLPCIDLCGTAGSAVPHLEEGRPRMSPELVFIFMNLRGYWGSVSDSGACERMRDSMTLHILFSKMGVKIPGATTIIENINCVSSGTRDFILSCQLRQILDDGLDNFSELQLDSTSVKASSSWPTDAGIIYRLLRRLESRGAKLDRLGLEAFKPFRMDAWMKELKALLFEINNTGSKKEKKLRKLYRRFLRTAHLAHGYLSRTLEKRILDGASIELRPSSRLAPDEFLAAMEDDAMSLSSVLYYSEDRVFNGVVLPASQKILSISDASAAFIKKGQREAVIGYKPQLCRSAEGFVTAMIVEKGNPSDSENLVPLVSRHILGTGVTPLFVSADSGYASGKGYSDCICLGVKDVCIGGSKGKALLPDDLWESEPYVGGRRMRSAVESLMFTLKYVFEFGRMRRRGLENVKAEMHEKIAAYNFLRMVRMKAERRAGAEGPSWAAA